MSFKRGSNLCKVNDSTRVDPKSQLQGKEGSLEETCKVYTLLKTIPWMSWEYFLPIPALLIE